MDNKNNKNEKELNDKLNNFLNTDDCKSEECKVKDADELVQRENKKIITNDGRQLLSEYVR